MVAQLTQWHKCRLLDNYVVVNEGIDIDNKAGDWEDLELIAADQADLMVNANPLPAAQVAPAQADQVAAQDAAAGAAEDADPRPPEQAAPIQAEQAEQAAPAQADQVAAQDAAAGAAEDADPRPPEQAAPIQAEQAEQAAPAQADQVAAQDAAAGAAEVADPRPPEQAAPIQAEQAEQAAPAQADQVAAQDAAPGAAEDADPRPPEQAAPIQAEQAEQAAPAQADQVAAQDAAAGAAEDADPRPPEQAAPIQAEQAEQADQAQVDAVVEAPPRGGLATSVFRHMDQMYKAGRLLLSKSLKHAAEELPLLPQDEVHEGWRETRYLFVLLRMPAPDAIHSVDMLCIYDNSSQSLCFKLRSKPLHLCKARWFCYQFHHPSFEHAPQCAGEHSITIPWSSQEVIAGRWRTVGASLNCNATLTCTEGACVSHHACFLQER